MRRLIYVLFLVLGTAAVADGASPILSLSGTGTVTVSPDLATVSLGVEVEAPTADRALRANSARMSQIFAALEDIGIDKKDIQTSQLSLYPQWDNNVQKAGDAPRVTGFVATNLLQVRVRDLPRLGMVLDALTKAGANRIQGISFGLFDPGPVLDAARKASVAEAVRKAGLYAEAANLTLGPIMSIDEAGVESAMPNFKMAAMAVASDAVPVAEGELTYSATVTIRFALIQK